MTKHGSGAKGHGAVTPIVIKTSNKDGSNVVNISLSVSEDGEIAEMFGVDAKGGRWVVKQLKFTLNRSESGDNDECKCCTKDPVTGVIRCLPCPCED